MGGKCAIDIHVLDFSIVAKRKATNLAVRVLGWRVVVSCFRNAICQTLGMQLKVWLVRKHPSHLGMQLKTKTCIHLRNFNVNATTKS